MTISSILLVPLYWARIHARTNMTEDVDLESKIRLAQGIVMDHLKYTAIPDDWIIQDLTQSPPITATELIDAVNFVDDGNSPPSIVVRVPENVQAAIFMMLSELYENRESSNAKPLSEAIIDLLSTKRDPTFS